MTAQLRRAGLADAEAVQTLFHRSFTATFGHLYPPATLAAFLDDCSAARFAAELMHPDFAIMLGEADGKLLGYCTLGPYDLDVRSDQRWWALRQIYLDASAMGSGLAQRLLDWAIAESRARHYQELYLTVFIDNHRARRFYDRNGFIEVGRHPFSVGNVVDDDRIMRLTL